MNLQSENPQGLFYQRVRSADHRIGAIEATTPGVEHLYREVILNPSSKPTDPQHLTWGMIYPRMKAIAIGESQQDYTDHYSVHQGFVEEMKKDGIEVSPDEPSVSCWLDRGKLSLRIEMVPKKCSHEEMLRLAAKYRDAIELVEARANVRGGRVVLEADSESQQLMAKILGKMHQVANVNASDVKVISNAVVDEKFSTDVRHIYDKNTGTRYFFVGDLETLERKTIFDLADFPGEAEEQALEKHRATVQATLGQLARFLTSFNSAGHREGELFVVDPTSGERISGTEELSNYVRAIVDLLSSVEASPRWKDEEGHIVDNLNLLIKHIKLNCDPDFHMISKQSTRFVQLVSQVLRSELPTDEHGRRFSTPLIPQEFGFFNYGITGKKEFVTTTSDPKLREIANWLFTEQAQEFIDEQRYPVKIVDADYVCVYKPQTTLTFEPHSPEFIRKLGDIAVESFVIEFGRFDSLSWRLILKENEYAQARWYDRLTPTVDSLLSRWHPLELANFVLEFKEFQHSLFHSVLQAVPDTRVRLAEKEMWVSVYGASDADEEIREKSFNYCVKAWVEGPRSDLIIFRDLSFSEQCEIVEMDGDISAVGILAQLPHIQRRDLIIHRDPDTNCLTGGTFLSAAESFCYGNGSSIQEKLKEYLQRVVPILYGNHIARRLAPLSYSSDARDASVVRQKQEQLIDIYTTRIKTDLLNLSTGLSAGGNGSREVILQAIQSAYQNRRFQPELWRPRHFKPQTFLPLTLELLNLERTQIVKLCEEIAATARDELTLIKTIAPIAEFGATFDELALVDMCADRVSSLIGAHLLKSDYLNRAVQGLKILAEADRLTVIERIWYITALDVNLRIAELHKMRTALPALRESFEAAKSGQEFYDRLRKRGLHIGLAYETITACYDAVRGLKAIYNDVSTKGEKLMQLNSILQGLQPLGKLIIN